MFFEATTPTRADMLNRGWWASFLSRRMTGEPNHCAVLFGGDLGVVLNTTVRGDEWWGAAVFIHRYPGLCRVEPVCRSLPSDPDRFASCRPRSVIRALLRYFTLGLVPGTDCVATAIRVCRAAGVAVPTRIVTPRQLQRFLHARRAKAA